MLEYLMIMEKPMSSIKILIAEDHLIFRYQLRSFLLSDPDIDIIGEVSDGTHVIQKSAKLKPDLILMDISMPVMNGLIATEQLNRLMPDIKIIILSVYDIEEYKKAAFEKGASGYVIKKDMMNGLIPEIKRVMKIPSQWASSEI